MEYKYKTNLVLSKVEKFGIVRETEHTIWIKNGSGKLSQHRKQSDNDYFDNFIDAKNYLIEQQKKEINVYKFNLEIAENKLEKIKTLEEITCTTLI